jgi:hypothetical protein
MSGKNKNFYKFTTIKKGELDMTNAVKNTKTCNGWINYNTWNAVLYLNNDEGVEIARSECLNAVADEGIRIAKKRFKSFLLDNFLGQATFDEVKITKTHIDAFVAWAPLNQ